MSDDPVTRILSEIERLRVEVFARLDRLESLSKGHLDLVPEVVVTFKMSVTSREDWVTGLVIVVLAVGLRGSESRPHGMSHRKNSYTGLFSDPVSCRRGTRPVRNSRRRL